MKRKFSVQLSAWTRGINSLSSQRSASLVEIFQRLCGLTFERWLVTWKNFASILSCCWFGSTTHLFTATTNDALVALFLNETLADNLDEAPDESAAEPKDRSTVSSAGDLQLVQWTFVKWSSRMSSGCTLILVANTIVYILYLSPSLAVQQISVEILFFFLLSFGQPFSRAFSPTNVITCVMRSVTHWTFGGGLTFVLTRKIEIFCSGYTGYIRDGVL